MVIFGKKLLVFITGSLIVEVVLWGLNNKTKGSTFLGRKISNKKRTYVDWNNNVYLSSLDYEVA